jgi:ESCRT-I complex subunit TSG101
MYRLLQLISDDLAIDDTFYVLGRALDAERIELDPFLKVCEPWRIKLIAVQLTRTLAREQFLKRATVKKIESILQTIESTT